MYTTLETLEYEIQKKRQKNLFKTTYNEIKIFVLIFVFIFCTSYLVTNAQLLQDSFNDTFDTTVKKITYIEHEKIKSIQTEIVQKQQTQKNMRNLINQYEGTLIQEREPAETLDQYLQSQLDSYHFQFNILPPTQRLIIDKINLNVPIIQAKKKSSEDDGIFDKELENGVVKYPDSSDPWQWGTTFLFWHTSQEYRKTNSYGTVFRNIPKLEQNDIIQMIRKGEKYQYKVLETRIVKPKEVNTQYLEFAEKEEEYLILMGCYPIGRTDKRMMIFAQRI